MASRTVTPLIPGTYIEEVSGFKPGFRVEVTLSANRIENITVLSHNDTVIIAQAVIDSIIPTIISQQSTAVDVVSGATLTSFGIIQAVQNAIAAAGGNPADYWAPVRSSPQHLSRTAIIDPHGTPRGPERTPRRWDESHDIVIVGGGHAGLMAAYAAANNGAQVLLIEKMSFLGGNSLITGGQMAFHDSRIAAEAYRRLNLPPDTAEQHIRDTVAGGDFQSFLPLVENFVHAGPFILNMLLDNGLTVREHITMPGGHYGFRVYGTTSGQGDDVIEVQKRMIERAGIDVRLNTKMVRIYREGNQSGRAVGIAELPPFEWTQS
ncbi:MAG: FAD-dependent oxidoreductase [Treponema sp.]|nr:FAD-dependent oxidoreductase [Treponema sp.]